VAALPRADGSTADRTAANPLAVNGFFRLDVMPYPLGMDWQTIANVSTAVGVVGAIAFGIRSDSLTRKGQKNEQTQAVNSAERSESAARLTEEYTRRVVDALETMATNTRNAGTSHAAPRVRWALANQAGSRYVLTNTGDATAHAVEVEAHESLRLIDLPLAQDLGPSEALEFVAARSLATSDSTITVKWIDNEGQQQVWRYPLPPSSR